jgi:hypothetical protein
VRRAPAAAALAAAALATPALAANVDWATATVSPSGAGHRATLTLKLHYEMTCGRPGPGPVYVHLPAKMGVPQRLVGGNGTKQAPATVSGHVVTVQLPKPPAVTCMSIAPATLTLTLTGVRNPATAGTYVVRARLHEHAFTAKLVIHS